MFTNKDIEDEINNKYTLEYFISKFEAIPSKEIGAGDLDDHCALYHCGVRRTEDDWSLTEESKALAKLFKTQTTDLELLCHDTKIVWRINDSGRGIINGDTSKERILNYLYQIRDNQSCTQ